MASTASVDPIWRSPSIPGSTVRIALNKRIILVGTRTPSSVPVWVDRRGRCQDDPEIGRFAPALSHLLGAGTRLVPDHNWGGSGMIVCRRCSCRPWTTRFTCCRPGPRIGTFTFKLHAPGNTTVEVDYRQGKVVTLEVEPETRAADIIR